MLILTVKKGEPVYLSGGITITINGHEPGRYTLAVAAPSTVEVVRDSALTNHNQLPSGHSSTADIIRKQREQQLRTKRLNT